MAFRQQLVDGFEQITRAVVVRGREWQRLGHAKAGEIRQRDGFIEAVNLVDHQQQGFGSPPQALKNGLVGGQQAVTGIDHEDDQVRFGDGQFHLARSQSGQPLLGIGKPAGIDHHERALAQAADSIVAITRDPGHVGDQGIARTRQDIEQGGFADVGATNQGDDGKHRGRSISGCSGTG